ncbi:unnamed protein product [Diamesa serratosioi]
MILLYFLLFAILSEANMENKIQKIQKFKSRDILLILYTNNSSESGEEIIFQDETYLEESDFNSNRPTILIIHGFLGDEKSYVNTELKNGYLANFDVNVIICDWSVGAQVFDYNEAVENAFKVGKYLAKFLDIFVDKNGLDYNTLTIIGHSLGAHIAGFIGKNVKKAKIDRIIGLDPAGPEFHVNPFYRLAATDYVESIHTDDYFGIRLNISQVDFFVNNGKNQPGCFQGHICSHRRAIDIQLESLTSTKLQARKCKSLKDIFKMVECNGVIGRLGGSPFDTRINEHGVYQLHTNSEPPYGKS